ncbi:MAG TPA: hypothetical protein VKU19_12325 [Bryobacteraceae bacterium]|nr:hypothetical protein [Bryobacteraceae bacterium]
MAGGEQDNSGEPKRPAVRLRTLPKKPSEPPPAPPIVPPQGPPGRPEVRLRRLAPKPASPEEPAAEGPVEVEVADGASEQEPPAGTVVESDPGVESAEKPPAAVVPPASDQDVKGVEPLASAPASGGGVRLRRLAKPAIAETSASPEIEVRPAAEASQAAQAPIAESAAAPGRKPYKPDPSVENMHRRQWWKYDLRVRSKRITPVQEKGQE